MFSHSCSFPSIQAFMFFFLKILQKSKQMYVQLSPLNLLSLHEEFSINTYKFEILYQTLIIAGQSVSHTTSQHNLFPFPFSNIITITSLECSFIASTFTFLECSMICCRLLVCSTERCSHIFIFSISFAFHHLCPKLSSTHLSFLFFSRFLSMTCFST